LIFNGNGSIFEQYACPHSMADIQSWRLPTVSEFYTNVYVRICNDGNREEYRR
jgi:hypothetical protein